MEATVADQLGVLRDVVERGLALTEGGLMPAQAARQVLADGPIGREAEVELMCEGLRVVIGAQLHWRRNSRSTDFSRYVRGTPRDRDEWADFVLSMPHGAADGTMKALLNFTVDDWTALADTFRTHAVALAKRAKVAEQAAGLLRASGVETTGDLPDADRSALASEVEKVWKL